MEHVLQPYRRLVVLHAARVPIGRHRLLDDRITLDLDRAVDCRRGELLFDFCLFRNYQVCYWLEFLLALLMEKFFAFS